MKNGVKISLAIIGVFLIVCEFFYGICFLLALFFSPLIEVVTSAVTTPALVVVGVLMAANFADINWKQFEVAVPAFITIIMMPLSYSIATGIACGFISGFTELN